MKYHSIVKAGWVWRPILTGAILFASWQLASAEDNPVVGIQKILKEKHFYFGDVAGNWDDATQAAVRRFQFRNGLPGTGELDPATLQTLAGNPPPPKAVAVNVAPQAERNSELARQIERDEERIAMKPGGNTDRRRNLSSNPGTNDGRAAPNVASTEQVPSWSASHRPLAGNAIEIRRALPVEPQPGAADGSAQPDPAASWQSQGGKVRANGQWEQPVPRAVAVSLENAGEAANAGRTIVTRVTAHFTGPDGHVYTYYKMRKTPVEDASASQASPISGAQAGFALPPQIPDWERSSNGGWRVVGR